MANFKKGDKDQQKKPMLSPEEKARIKKASRQLPSYANFLRWTATFSREEVKRHRNHDRIMLLSPMQSGRFCFAVEGNTLILGVQQNELCWLEHLPLEAVYITDRIYLVTKSVNCMETKLQDLIIGIFVDDINKLNEMKQTEFMQVQRVIIHNGQVAEVGRSIGLGVPVKHVDIIRSLVAEGRERIRQKDVGRFF